MNRIKATKISIWAVLLLGCSYTHASEGVSSLNLNMVGPKAFEINVNNVSGDIKISISNADKHDIYHERTTPAQGSFKRTFDLNLIPDGQYSIEIVDGEKAQFIPLLIENNQLQIKTTEKVVHFLPIVSKKQNVIRVNMPAFSEEYLAIYVLNENDEVLYEENLKGERNLGKIFDFSSSAKGSYKFLLSSKAGLVTKEILID